MGKIILICGKICSGKSYYGRKIADEINGVILSCDETSADLFHHSEGENFDAVAADIKRYLHKIALRIAKTGGNVVLDWGFWKADERRSVSEYYRENGIEFEWHYIDISDSEWQSNIELRNKAVLDGISDDFYVDGGLLEKLEANFEYPDRKEIDLWLNFSRE